jgi:transcriptional regulator with XRE-family HTH domain
VRQSLLPERLKELIKRAGSQSQLARESGVGQELISLYAAGKAVPSVDRAAMLARAGGVSISWLVGESNGDSGRPAGDYVSLAVVERALRDAEEILVDVGIEPGEMSAQGRVEFIVGVIRAAMRDNWYPDLTGVAKRAPARGAMKAAVIALARLAA